MEQFYTTFLELQKQHSNKYIPYESLLSTVEWKIRRDSIVRRDKGLCTMCRTLPTQKHTANGKTQHLIDLTKGLNFHQIVYDSPVVLQVHHLYYIVSRLPWEYEDEALITLCDSCHKRVHDEVVVPVYAIRNGEMISIQATACNRCSGTGYLPKYMYYKDGVCFECGGERYMNSVFQHK